MRFGSWILIVALIVFGKLTGLLKDIMLTFYHGISVTTDAYFLSGAITGLLHSAVYLSIPVLVVPLYVRLLKAGDRVASDQKISATLLFFVAVSLSLSFVGIFGAPTLLNLFAHDVEMPVYSAAVRFLPIMSASFALSSMVAVSNAVQTVNAHTTPSYIVPLANNTIFCVGLVVFSDSPDFYKILVLGIFSWFVLTLLNYWNARKWFSIRLASLRANLPDKAFYLLLLPAILSFYIEQANSFVGIYFASDLSAGSISVLTYANKLSLIFLGLFVVFLTATLFPKMATVASRGNTDELTKYILRIVGVIVVVGAPLVLFMVFYAVEVVETLFKRGSFDDQDAIAVSAVFSIAILSLPFCLIRDVMNRVYFSFDNTTIPVMLSGAAFLTNVALSFLLYREYELLGLATAAVTAVTINCAVIVGLAQRRFGIRLIDPVLRTLGSSVVACGFSYLLLSWLDNEFQQVRQFWPLLIVPFSALYFLVLVAARNGEALLLVQWARSLLKTR